MVANILNIDKETAWQIVSDNLSMEKVCAKMVPTEKSHSRSTKYPKSYLFWHLITTKFAFKIIGKCHPHVIKPGYFNMSLKQNGNRRKGKDKSGDQLKDLISDKFKHCFEQFKISMQRCIAREWGKMVNFFK